MFFYAGMIRSVTQEKNCFLKKNTEYILILLAIAATAVFIRVGVENTEAVVPASMIAAGLVSFGHFCPGKAEKTLDYVYRYRWILALTAFVLCVLLRLQGSSIGMYNSFFPEQITDENSTLFGIARNIRTDEYGVQTMKFFSQYYNDYGLYSTRMSLSETNMVLDYYSPVWDWTALGKPLMWGYLLFGNDVGLSWYWCGQVILLFMTAFEMVMILTRKDRLASFLGAVMMLLSPAVQWWMLPHMPIVLMYAMGLFCVGYHFFKAKSLWTRGLFSLLAFIAALGFALSIFPSYQVPCTYAVLILLVVCLLRSRRKITFRGKDWLFIALPLAGFCVVLGHYLYTSADDIKMLLGTIYPGGRMMTGKTNSWRDLFPSLTALFLPYKDATYLNNCEASTAIHFAPFFLCLMPRITIYLKKRKSKDLYAGFALSGILLLYGVYMCIGIPEIVAKITFLKYCNRMRGVYDWVAVMFTAWGIHVLLKHPGILKNWQKAVYPALYGLVCTVLPDENCLYYFATLAEKLFSYAGISCCAVKLSCLLRY